MRHIRSHALPRPCVVRKCEGDVRVLWKMEPFQRPRKIPSEWVKEGRKFMGEIEREREREIESVWWKEICNPTSLTQIISISLSLSHTLSLPPDHTQMLLGVLELLNVIHFNLFLKETDFDSITFDQVSPHIQSYAHTVSYAVSHSLIHTHTYTHTPTHTHTHTHTHAYIFQNLILPLSLSPPLPLQSALLSASSSSLSVRDAQISRMKNEFEMVMRDFGLFSFIFA